MGAIRGMGRLLSDLLFFLTMEGNWAFRPHEKVVLKAALDSLPDHDKSLLYSQIHGLKFVQRSHRQIARPRFYRGLYQWDLRKIEHSNQSEMIIEVQLDVEGHREVAQVEFFQGRVDTIQFKRSAKFYKGKDMNVVSAGPGKLSNSIALEIDRQEHGTQHHP